MKNQIKLVLLLAVFATPASFANPKCSHRVATSGNDLLRNTNPLKVKVASASTTKTGREHTRSGVR